MQNATRIACCLFAGYLTSTSLAAQQRVMIEWRFDHDGERLGWQPNSHIAQAEVRNRSFRGHVTDWDPILLGPVFEIPASPTQAVEIQMSCSDGGRAELFWTETLEGQFGGFNQAKSEAFSCLGDEQFHTYTIHPFWHAAGKIVRLRVDVPASATFAIAWIRIVDTSAEPSTAKHWRFTSNAQRWRAWQDVAGIQADSKGLMLSSSGKRPTLLSPLVEIAADKTPIVFLRMSVTEGSQGRIWCVNRSQFGAEAITFPIISDGQMHSYNVDMGGLRRWRGKVILVGVQPTDSDRARVRIESIEIAERVLGPAELQVQYFGRAEGVNRVERPAQVLCTVRNLGGTIAHNVAATLTAPQGISIVGQETKQFEPISLYLPKTVAWQVVSHQPGLATLSMTLHGSGIETVEATCPLQLTARPAVPRGSYVPEPEPVKPVVDVGVFYFPGWQSSSRWAPIREFPMRKPVLGWYDESNPECADWQIKWAVEHGITFFLVDWYWSDGQRQLEHWLHNAYMKARYRRYLKWAVMWANHNAPGTHSVDDWRHVNQYWIDHYFGMTEYYRIDGRPAVFIWSPQNIRRDLGGSDQAARLYAMSQQMAREAGFAGVYFVAMSSHDSPGHCRELGQEGYEAFTSYHAFQLAERTLGTQYFSYEQVVRTSPQVWTEADARSGSLDYFPIVDTGWSSEPWHRSAARVIYERTPERFGRLCHAAKQYAAQKNKRLVIVGPWNEWGEGSYIEPYAEHGFDDLDAMRLALCPPGEYPPNLIPADVGLGPYDLDFPEPQNAWQFNTDGDSEGWTSNGVVKTRVESGLLVGQTFGPDPILQSPAIQLDALQYRTLTLRLRSNLADTAQLFWGTTLRGPSETNSTRIPLAGDNQFHDYRIDMGANPAWRGIIVSLRFDPATRTGTQFAIDQIRLDK